MIHVTITSNGEPIEFDTHGLLLAAEAGDEGVRCVKIKESLTAAGLLAILGAATKMAQDELNKLEELLGDDDAEKNKEE